MRCSTCYRCTREALKISGIVRHPLGIVAAVRVLDDILRRKHAHQSKKPVRLRSLSLAHRFTGYPSRRLEPHPGLLQVRRLKALR